MPALTEGLHRAVKLKPDAPSTSLAPRRRTWRQTAERVSRVAGALKALEVGRGDRVAILAQNSDRYFELMYAAAWVGAAARVARAIEDPIRPIPMMVTRAKGNMARRMADRWRHGKVRASGVVARAC